MSHKIIGQTKKYQLLKHTRIIILTTREWKIRTYQRPKLAGGESTHSTHRKAPSGEFSCDLSEFSSSTYEEVLHNHSNRLPRPIASFGFGGKIVTMFPKRAARLNVMDTSHNNNSSLPYSENGDIGIQNISQLCNNEKQQLETFPGPLFGKNTVQDKDKIIEFINGVLMRYRGTDIGTKQLWELLRLLIHSTKEKTNVNDILRNIKNMLLQSRDTWKKARDSSTSHQQQRNDPSRATERMQQLLVEGNIKDACNIAVQNKLWGHALLLASMIDKSFYSNVLYIFYIILFFSPPTFNTFQNLFRLLQNSPKIFQMEIL